MIKTESIPLNDSRWMQLVSQAKQYDFYHTNLYHRIELLGTNHQARLWVYQWENSFIALPIILREIPDTNCVDITSAYGYVGPISNLDLSAIAPEVVESFQEYFLNFLKKERVVSIFSRLHPLIETTQLFNDFGNVRALNKTVAIDLSKTPDEQRSEYRKSNKSEINQLRKKKGYTVVEAKTAQEVEQFKSIYEETMQRVGATDYYFFSTEYYTQLIESKEFDARLLLAKQEDEIAAAAIFIHCSKFMQYHLAGTLTAYVKDTPMKLLLDHARLLANEMSLEYLHLGGGVGGSDEDSLFRFKSGFSKHFCRFHTWQLIVDEQKYAELTRSNGVKETTFFPAYRAKKKHE